MNYPKIGGLVLDATFDTLSNVAAYQVPWAFHMLLMPMINTRLYMNIGKQVISETEFRKQTKNESFFRSDSFLGL